MDGLQYMFSQQTIRLTRRTRITLDLSCNRLLLLVLLFAEWSPDLGISRAISVSSGSPLCLFCVILVTNLSGTMMRGANIKGFTRSRLHFSKLSCLPYPLCGFCNCWCWLCTSTASTSVLSVLVQYFLVPSMTSRFGEYYSMDLSLCQHVLELRLSGCQFST